VDISYTSLSASDIPAIAWGDSRWLQAHDFPF
jgi:hypothetical protein